MDVAQQTLRIAVGVEAFIPLVRDKVHTDEARLIAAELSNDAVRLFELAPAVQSDCGRNTYAMLKHVISVMAAVDFVKIFVYLQV